MSKFHAIYGNGGGTPEPGGDIHGEVQTLLWTNPNTKTNFDAKKVELNLSRYDGVIIEYAFSTNNSNISSRIKLEKNISYAYGGGYIGNSDTASARNVAAIDDTGVTFTDNKNTVTANNANIPLKIYGYRQYEAGSISGTPQKSFEQNVEFDIGIGNYCIATIVGLSEVDVTPSVGEVVCSIKQAEASKYFYAQLIKSANGKVKLPYRGEYNIVVVGD